MRNRVIICSSFEMVSIGLAEIIDSLAQFDVVACLDSPEYLSEKMMNKEIADQMNLSVHTVISHRKNITRKTGIKSVSGLTVYALLNNLIDENELI